MRLLHCFLTALVFTLIIATASRIANAQGVSPSPQPPASEVESLRRQVEEQKTRIQQLQADLQQQSQALAKQQEQLNAMLLKMEQLGSGVPTVKLVNASMTIPASTGEAPVEESTTNVPAVPEQAKADDGPKSVQAGFGNIKFNGLFQGWFGTGDGGFRDTFRIRRVELKFSGDIAPHVKWTVMIEPSRGLSLNNTLTTINGNQVVRDVSINQGSRILQDAFVTLSHIKRMNVDFGQLKLPLSLEGTQSSSRLDTVERALFLSDGARGGNLGDVRDIGVMLYGPLDKSVDYFIGVFNGVNEHQNDVDRNDQKAVIGRLVFRPSFIKGLQIGGSGAWGNGPRVDQPRRNRAGAEMLFTRSGFTLKSEVMTAKDSAFQRLGYYGHFGYRFRPKLEAIFRFDSFDPDTTFETNATNVTERDYIAGVNYFIKENHVKLQFNFLRKTFNNSIVPSRNLFLMNLQTSW